MVHPSMKAISEAQLQACVMDLAKLHGLHVHHCRPARMASGKWATPIEGHKGFPDLVIVGPAGVLFRELKNATNKLSPEQVSWLHTLDLAGADAGVWRPEDWARGRGRIADEIHALAGRAS